MTINVNYSIFIGVSVDGHQAVNLWFFEDKNKIIGCLTEGYNTTETVTKLIETINDVTLNRIPKAEIRSKIDEPPAFTLKLTYDDAEFINEYSAYESVKIKTSELKTILFELLYFLKKYENNEIPNLTYNLQKE